MPDFSAQASNLTPASGENSHRLSMKIVPNITGQQLESALGKIGFSVARVIGSHLWITHPDGRSTSMPIHEQETLQPGLVFKILRDIDLDSLDLYDLL